MTTPTPNGNRPNAPNPYTRPREIRYPRGAWVPPEMVEEDRARQRPEPHPTAPGAPETSYIGAVRPPVPETPPREPFIPRHPSTSPIRAQQENPGLATEIFTAGGAHRAQTGRRVNVHRQRLILIASVTAFIVIVVLSIVLMRLQ